MSGLTLGDINNYLIGATGIPRISTTDNCTTAASGASTTGIRTNGAGNTYNIKDADAFLLSRMNLAHITFNTSDTTNDNFLTLYNDQYARNTEAFVGILIISAILAKMIFYPISI
jgi:hypothetical protein